MKDYFNGKTILITGGAGAFGQKFISSMVGLGVAKVVILSRDEMKHASLKRSALLKDCADWIECRIGDVTRIDDLELAMQGVDLVIHSAAMKHLPECESNPMASTRINVSGTENVARTFLKSTAKDLIFLSTDKAPAASSVYGAQKYLGEKIITETAKLAGPGRRAFCLRYSNVIDSTGSAFKLFAEILSAGREVTVNGANTQRGFVTQDSVCTNLKHFLHHAKGGEVFVFRPVVINIADLANSMKEIIGRGSVVVKETLGTGWEKESAVLVMHEEAALAKSPSWIDSKMALVLDFLNRDGQSEIAELGSDNCYALCDCPVLTGSELKEFLTPVMRNSGVI